MSVTAGSRAAGIGSAGRRGEGIRSDLWVQLEARSRGGIELDLRSRVEAYYGDAIRAQVEGVLAALGVTAARVTLEDAGALPFVIQARLEAAAVAAGVAPGADARPARTAALTPEAPRTRMPATSRSFSSARDCTGRMGLSWTLRTRCTRMPSRQLDSWCETPFVAWTSGAPSA